MGKLIIPFEYCSLERASKFLNCEIEDIFHWWETRKITLCLNYNYGMADFLTKYGTYYKGESYFDNMDFDFQNEHASFTPDSVYMNKEERMTLRGEHNGLWIPAPALIEGLISGDPYISFAFWIQAYGVSDDMRLWISHQEVNLDTLVIPKKEIETAYSILNGVDSNESSINNQQLLTLLGGILKKITSSKARKWTQADLANHIADEGIPNLGERSVNGIFSEANKAFKSIK